MCPLSGLRNLFQPVPLDPRARRMVAVIECQLNQNARAAGAACTPAQTPGLAALCEQLQVGLLQLACPEIHSLGMRRARPSGVSLRDAMETPPAMHGCRQLAMQTASRMAVYDEAGCQLLAVVGGNMRSPGCAVHPGCTGLRAESGVFMLALQQALRERGLDPPFVALRDADPALYKEDLAALTRLLALE